ncbi:MAG: hypothetical protein PVJ01_02705 [Pseudomonadota bacterium]
MSVTFVGPSELLSCTISFFVLLYVFYARRALHSVKYSFITYGFYCVAVALFLAGVEGFLLTDLIKVIEQAFLSAGALFITVGCRRLHQGIRNEKGVKP